MKPIILSLLIALPLSVTASVDASKADGISYSDPQGWQWYQDPSKIEDDEEIIPEAPPLLTSSKEKQILQAMTEEALDTAILYPTPENIRKYRLMQDFWTDKATDFTKGWEKALLLYPELDYNLKYSHYNGTASTQMADDRAKEKLAINELAKNYGIFFFYRGNDPIDSLLVPVVKSFAEEHKIAVVPVTVDGVVNPTFPRSFRDNGHVEKMGVKHFPALYLVEPKAEEFRPLSYGFKSQDDIARAFYNVATDFKPNF